MLSHLLNDMTVEEEILSPLVGWVDLKDLSRSPALLCMRLEQMINNNLFLNVEHPARLEEIMEFVENNSEYIEFAFLQNIASKTEPGTNFNISSVQIASEYFPEYLSNRSLKFLLERFLAVNNTWKETFEAKK